MALRDYLTTEVGEDWVDGIITRREALRRLALLGMSVTSASALLAACAAETRPSGASPTAGPATAPSGSTPVSSPGGPATQVPPVAGEAITFAGPRGTLQGFFALAGEPNGVILVIHENRGLTDHIRAVATRFAGDGYAALAIDLVSEEGGTAAVGDPGNVSSALAAASGERLVADMRAGLDELERRLPGKTMAVTGFCFGGGMVWTLLDAGEPRLAAAIPFYGPAPSGPDFTGERAAVLGIYAEQDARVNASRDTAAAALAAAGVVHEMKTYPGVDHAFFNDTGGRYDATQAAAAYADVLSWLRTHMA